MTTIKIHNLNFGYQNNNWIYGKRDIEILKDINLEIKKGEIFVILGHNGAGKTTLLRLLLNFLPITSGEAFINGIPVTNKDSRAKVGFVSEQPIMYPHLDGPGFLNFFANMAGLPARIKAERIAVLLEKTGLVSHGNKPLTSYSKGMLQRLNLARCLLTDPTVVFLDEPILGLDPFGQQLVRNMVMEMREAGKTVFINTHATTFAREIADRIAFLMSGSIQLVINKSELADVEPPYKALIHGDPDKLPSQFSTLVTEKNSNNTFTLTLPDEEARRSWLTQSENAGFRVVRLDSLVDPIEQKFNELAQALGTKEKSQ